MMMEVKLTSIDYHLYLGEEFNKDLSWSSHIKNMWGKSDQTLNIMRRNLNDCLKDIKDIAYNAYVRQHLEYSSTASLPAEKYQ